MCFTVHTHGRCISAAIIANVIASVAAATAVVLVVVVAGVVGLVEAVVVVVVVVMVVVGVVYSSFRVVVTVAIAISIVSTLVVVVVIFKDHLCARADTPFVGGARNRWLRNTRCLPAVCGLQCNSAFEVHAPMGSTARYAPAAPARPPADPPWPGVPGGAVREGSHSIEGSANPIRQQC